MHYSVMITGDPYEAMAPYQEMYEQYDFNEELWEYVDENWDVVNSDKWKFDWFSIWGRWYGYIWVRDLNEKEPYEPDEWIKDELDYDNTISKRMWRCSAIKSNIAWFQKRDQEWTDEYPYTYAYIDEKWFHEIPNEWDYKDDDWRFHKSKFEYAKKKWRREFIKWYKSIPDDEVVTIVDYHT